jgi:hypothetical protein
VEFTCPNNLFFECNQCGLCCGDTEEKIRHILLLEAEANKISTETSLPKQAFTKPITTKNPYCYEMKKNGETPKKINMISASQSNALRLVVENC